ncbi:hypothetical protein L6164_010080 [Bauhinia variegata]|uniref:Uncharacterized protein n=1 Tax=Bauhinia variegata TaxID=167791 RepID=A0ACB9PL54_BAUVA|nr:hypothetical protein L6164_010080 [Bauhinia variegata]
MRDALRSPKRLGKPEDDMVSEGGVVETKRDDTGQQPSNLTGEVLVHERETSNLIDVKEEMEVVVNEESALDLDTGTGRGIGVDENRNKRRRLSSGDAIEEAGTEMTEKKKQGLNGKVQIGGRVLRSMLKREDDKKTGNGENNGVVVGESRDSDGFKKITVKEEADEFASAGYQKEDDKLRINDNDEKKSKRKRGRPPKVEMKEQDQLVGEMHGKHGRPPKMEIKEEYQSVGKLPRKRGRPPKMEKKEQDHSVGELHQKRGRSPKMEMKEQDQSVAELHRKRGRPPKMEIEVQNQFAAELHRKRGRPPKMEMEEKDQPVGLRKRGRPPKAGLKYNIFKVAHHRKGKVGFGRRKKPLKMRDDDVCSKNNSGKELKSRRFSTVKKSIFGKTLETKSNEVASPLRSNFVEGPVAEKNGKSQEKQFVRDKIKELLFAAGWEVDYRPRNGKEYNDAVYVSLDKKTHWSITLAYNRLKMHYEAGDGEDKVYRAGFKFTPIPQEEFNILTKVINKKRESKQELKQKGKDEGKMGKSMKGKKKRRCSLLEEDDRHITSTKGKLLLVKDDKRLKTKSKKRFAPLVRNAEKESDSEDDGYIPYDGKRTVLAWMIDLGTVLQNAKVYYMKRRTKSKVEGRIMGDGIHCDCCKEIVTVSEFEVHAGSKLCDPFKNIYTEGGTSLLQCLLDSWNKQDESELKGFHSIDVAGEDPNDDTCGVCGDGGDLICCDGCPSTFHQSCLDISKFPSGDWHCIYCCCTFCGLFGRSTDQNNSCDDITAEALLTCCLCEEKYHRSCIEANCVKTDDSSDASFCGKRCQELSQRLEMLFGVKHEIEDGFSWTFIRQSDVGSDASQLKPEMVECNSKLAVALSVMDECFKPYIDHRSGINLIHSILYNRGSNFKRLNYGGFFTAILERGDEIICAASIRIHGNELAEMPFIGTRHMYRRQGMCRRLLNAIESALSSLNVELLVIPAISEMRNTWTSVFGFEPLKVKNKRKIKNMSLLVFPHVDMLQKNITEQHQFADENMIPTEVSCLQRQKNPTVHEVVSKCDVEGSSGSDGVLGSSACQVNETMSTEFGSPRDNVSDDAHNQAEEIKTYQNADSSCIVLAHDEKTVDLDTPLNTCGDSKEERQCLSMSRISTEGTQEGRCGSGFSQGTENMHSEGILTDEIVTNNNHAVDSPHHLVESIPPESRIVLCSGDSKQSAGVICHDSESTILSTADVGTVYDGSVKLQLAESVCESDKRISDCCEPRSNLDFVQPDSAGSKEVHSESATGCGSRCRPNGGCASSEAGPPTCVLMHLRKQNNPDDLFIDCKKSSNVVSEQNADEAEVLSVRTTDHQTSISSVDRQTVQLTSRSCAEIANGVNDSTKASSAAGSDTPLADGNIVLNDKPLMNQSSVVALHCASADGTPCSSSSTEAIVLSNQAS